MIGTVTALIAYAGARGTVIADDAATLQALVRASDYIQFTYLDGLTCTLDSDNVVEAAYEAAIAEVQRREFGPRHSRQPNRRFLSALAISNGK